MAGKESQPGFGRKVETTVEKGGGALAVIVGAVSLDVPLIAIGVVAFLVGKARTPRPAQ